MIAVTCASCQKKLSVKDELAGKRVKCPGCGKPVAVPQPATSFSPQPASREDDRTLPPKAPTGDQGGQPPRKESVSDVGELTALGGARGEATHGAGSDKPSPELYDFLAPAQAPDELGRLGPFRVLKVLGAGGMGVVYKAEDPQLKRLVALKAMLPTLGASESARKRFLREAQSAANIVHDHIVPIHQVGEDRGVPFMAMQFLEGEPLDVRLKREGRLSIADAIRIGREVAEGLAAAHEKGLVHRDIKPGNIWLESRRVASGGVVSSKGAQQSSISSHHSPITTHHSLFRVKILDFGLARAAADDTHLTQTGAIVGTPAYMAPEQAEGKPVDFRCDLFSLGCVLYRMCTGEMPFKGDSTLAIISSLALHNPKPPAKLDADVPPALSDLVMKLLAKNPADRPESAHAVAEALAEIEKSSSLEPKVTGTKAEVRSQRSEVRGPKARRPLLIGGGILGAMVLGLVIFFLASRERQRPELLQNVVTEPPIKSSPGAGYALDFDGVASAVEIPSLVSDGTHPLTVECYCVPRRPRANQFVVVMLGKGGVGLFMGDSPSGPVLSFNAFLGGKASGKSTNFGDGANKKHHLAAVWDGNEYRMYLNGKQTGTAYSTRAHATMLTLTTIGGSTEEMRQKAKAEDVEFNKFDGIIDEVRISKVARYDKDFTPAKRFEPDKDTLALYHCDEGQGNKLIDSSGNGHHGTKTGAKWIKADDSPIGSFTNSLGMEFVLVPKGKSWLGGGGGKPGDKEVEIKEDFYLGKYEVTQEEWQKVTGKNPSEYSRAGFRADEVKDVSDADLKRFPVETVTWEACDVFIKELNKRVKEQGWEYRLPTEAEWEYACRGGPMKEPSESAFHFYLDKPSNILLPAQALFEQLQNGRPRMVGSYAPNALGLHDMHGNVWEWCGDKVKPLPDPKYPDSFRVARGGSYSDIPGRCWASARHQFSPTDAYRNMGLRVARVPVGKEIVKLLVPDAGDADRRAALWALSVGGVVTIKEAAGYMTSVEKLPPGKITVLTISFNNFNEAVNDAGLENLRGLAEVTQIGLSDNGHRVTDKGLAILATNKKLTYLSLGFGGYGGKITDAGLQVLRDLPALSSLNLRSQGALTDAGLKFLRHLKDLKELDVANSRMTADAVIATARECWPRIGSLVLGQQPVSEQGLKDLAQLPELRHLQLNDVKLQDAHLRHLGALRQLNQLCIVGTGISDAGLDHLHGCAALDFLQVIKNKITAAGVEKLRKALPKCRIEWDGGGVEPSKKAATLPSRRIPGKQQPRLVAEVAGNESPSMLVREWPSDCKPYPNVRAYVMAKRQLELRRGGGGHDSLPGSPGGVATQ